MKYTTLLLDNDDTLMDFGDAERQAIKRTLLQNDVPYSEELRASYSAINDSLWKRLEKKEIERDQIFTERFRLFKEKHGFSFCVEKIAADYMKNLELGHTLMPDALALLEDLQDKYDLYIVTNGHGHTQNRRIDDADIRKYFKGVFISEEIGHQKPQTEYFSYVFKNIRETDKSKILLIGDSLSSDIAGGNAAGIDTCWFNHKNHPAGAAKPTYEIKTLKELYNYI